MAWRCWTRIAIFMHFIVQIMASSQSNLECTYPLPVMPSQWIVMSPECIEAMTELINLKLNNSIQYLAFGAFFSLDFINRPGFASVFYDNADDNRDCAIDLIDYVLLRGEYTSPNDVIDINYSPNNTEWSSVVDALNEALDLEAKTTDKYHDTITICEQFGVNDYHIANWLAQYFLQDQYDNQKYFADLISSLLKMFRQHEEFGEYLLDIQV